MLFPVNNTLVVDTAMKQVHNNRGNDLVTTAENKRDRIGGLNSTTTCVC